MNLLTKPIMYGLAAAVVAFLALAALQTHRLANAKLETAQVQRTLDTERNASIEAAFQQSQAFRKQERIYADNVARIDSEAQVQLASIATERDLAVHAAAGLRSDLAGYLAAHRRRAQEAFATGQRAPAEDPAGVLAKLLERIDERAGVLAEFADRASAAGRACERAYDSTVVLRPYNTSKLRLLV